MNPWQCTLVGSWCPSSRGRGAGAVLKGAFGIRSAAKPYRITLSGARDPGLAITTLA